MLAAFPLSSSAAHALADAAFWAAVAVCALAQMGILRSAAAAHPLPDDATGLPRVRQRSEVAWAIVPAVGLALVLAATWRAIHAA